MLTTIPPTLHSPGRPRTPAQAPHQRLLALSPPPPPPAAALPRRAGRPQLCAVAGATSGRPAPHPRHPHAALAAPQARPPAASAARLWGALSPPCGSRALGSRQPGSCPSRERGARGGQPPVRRSRLGWAEPARARAPGRQGRRGRAGGAGGRVDGGQDGPPRSPRASGRTGPGGGTREEKEDKEEKEEKEGPGGRRTFGQRGGGARDQKRACLASPSGNRTPVSRVTGGDTHHYTNEDGGGGRPGARPLSARPPAGLPACPRPPGPSTSRAPVLPGARHVPRATAHPARPPGRRVSAHSSPPARLGASRPRTRRRPRPAARGWRREKTPDTSPLEAWVRIPLLTRPPFGPPNAGSPHPGLDDALSVPPYTPLRAAGCGLRAAGWRRPGTRQPRAEMPAAPRGPGHAPTEGRASLASSLSQPRPTPPPARPPGARGPHGLSFPPAPIHSVVSTPSVPGAPTRRGHPEASPRPHARQAGSRALRAPARDGTPAPFAGPGPGGGVGSTPPWWLRGALSARQPCLPGPPPRRKPLRGRGSRTPARSLTAPPPASQPAAAPPKRTCRPHPHRSPAGPDGELRAELTRLSLASWLGRYSAAPISDDDTDADTHTRAPTPPPPPRGTPGAHTIRAPGPSRPPPARTARAGEPSAHGPSGGRREGREGPR
ncbi:basic proline-rich protein-like [Canis lupus familiaris]|uniref:basic proline-rich protein-like n=1 Tax=Canis lupus familiaris TaxID=9615 RepID=UPI0018F3DF91|nr:basic proline-rich protein-like [Canis lupus familiaris]